VSILTDDYLNRFGGLGRLYGKQALERLAAAHVCVVGVGGVGSWTVEGLARSGVGAITLIDLDDVCITNVNRQLPALDGQIGHPKTAVLAERVNKINPACRVTAVAEFFTSSTAEHLLAQPFNCLVDAIDNLGNKALLVAACNKRGIPCVTVGGAGGKRDGTGVRVGDLGESTGDELLRLLRKKLRKDFGFEHGEDVYFGIRCVYSQEKPLFPWKDGSCQAEPEPGSNLRLDCSSGFGTAVFVTSAFGMAAAGEAVRQIIREAI
jgi:tRNA A37 threonylcarbamoyladenosine dehydratase